MNAWVRFVSVRTSCFALGYHHRSPGNPSRNCLTNRFGRARAKSNIADRSSRCSCGDQTCSTSSSQRRPTTASAKLCSASTRPTGCVQLCCAKCLGKVSVMRTTRPDSSGACSRSHASLLQSPRLRKVKRLRLLRTSLTCGNNVAWG